LLLAYMFISLEFHTSMELPKTFAANSNQESFEASSLLPIPMILAD